MSPLGPAETAATAESVVARIPTSSGRPLSVRHPLVGVVQRVEPVAEALCARERMMANCDFGVAVDDDPSAPPNAFQTLDAEGRPVVVFTSALLGMAQNPDELAFVLGHEAAHHIAGHINKRQTKAQRGAILAGILGQVAGLSDAEILQAQNAAAGQAAKQYSKDYELEADALGAEIAWAAGYDPLRGAAFFTRLPDPGESASSHPANAQRQAVVAQVVRHLQGGGR